MTLRHWRVVRPPEICISPLIYGGHQERNRRGGTESVPLIVGMGKAAELARKHLPDYDKKVRPLRDVLEEGILSSDSKHRIERPQNAAARQHLKHYLPRHRIRRAVNPSR